MRITIEIDDKGLIATDVSSQTGGATPDSLADPPAELLAAARARGAQSAGPAAFVQAAGVAWRRPGELIVAASAAPVTAATRAGADLDAGRAAVPGAKEAAAAPAPRRRRAKARGARRGQEGGKE